MINSRKKSAGKRVLTRPFPRIFFLFVLNRRRGATVFYIRLPEGASAASATRVVAAGAFPEKSTVNLPPGVNRYGDSDEYDCYILPHIERFFFFVKTSLKYRCTANILAGCLFVFVTDAVVGLSSFYSSVAKIRRNRIRKTKCILTNVFSTLPFPLPGKRAFSGIDSCAFR